MMRTTLGRICLLLALASVPFPAAGQQRRSQTSPDNGDTTGYWQQHVRYRIVAVLDEERSLVRGTAQLTYVNRSPDTLREMYFHQYLNAFRPGSAWSRADEREGRTRFQHLADPDYGFERFTPAVLVNGRVIAVEYPGAPDSTVARIQLPTALRPGDSVEVSLGWEARPSTVPRRQGRRGRTYDFAQWYPKVAVYDRGGWQPNALVPAGEFYGEFGEYDVTLILPDDAVVGATGVPVAGDPGWARVLRGGTVTLHANAYGDVGAPASQIPAGMRAVRFVARDVHHFAWSVSPDYRYEGGTYVRAATRPTRFRTWDTVAVHVLYKPGDEQSWGNGQAVERTKQALAWLERVYGPYGYPQVTNLHRLDGGGTEFPMMMMNGSASPGLILHEGGHIFTYGILANNEWQSGWMDEGLTSYQTAWATGNTPQERAASRTPPPPPPVVRGYRGLALRINPADQSAIERYRIDLLGRAEPIGTRGQDFNEFAIYNAMIYARAQAMYGALRDVLGDSVFAAFLRAYYDRWAMRHVDEHAMRRVAEDVSGLDLRWFFDQWVRRVGLVDYSLKETRITQDSAGWLTTTRVVKRGEFFHPVALGVRTDSGWTFVRAIDPMFWAQRVSVRTASRPLEVRIDPLRTGDDWYGPNDTPHVPGPLQVFWGKNVVDWPFLDQAHPSRILNLWAPMAWYGEPGGATVGLRMRTSYHGWLNRTQLGVAITSRQPDEPPNPMFTDLHVRHVDPFDRLQIWATAEDSRLPWQSRPVIGQHLGAWAVDGMLKLDVRKSWDVSRFLFASGPRRSLSLDFSGAYPIVHSLLDSTRWSGLSTNEVTMAIRVAPANTVRRQLDGELSGSAGYQSGRADRDFERDFYARIAATGRLRAAWLGSRAPTLLRLMAVVARQTPVERAILSGAQNSITTFSNHWYRPANGILSRPSTKFVPLGGTGFRWGNPFEIVDEMAVVLNAEQDLDVLRFGPTARPLRISINGWMDTGASRSRVGDTGAGAGIVARGYLFDRVIRLRLDAPAWSSRTGGRGERFRFSFSDLW